MRQNTTSRSQGSATNQPVTRRPPPGLATAGPISLSQLMQQHQQNKGEPSSQPTTTPQFNIPSPPPGFVSSSSSLSDLVRKHRDPGCHTAQTGSHSTRTMSTLVNRFDSLYQPSSPSSPSADKPPVACPASGSMFSLVIGRGTLSGKVTRHQAAARRARIVREMRRAILRWITVRLLHSIK